MPEAFKGMSLFTYAGERKYLTDCERKRFIRALAVLDCPHHRTFCETIYWTGCRPSEALTLSALSVDLSAGMIILRSLKKRGRLKGRHFRPVPVPMAFIERLGDVHGILANQARPDRGESQRLWTFSRTTGWRLVKTVMEAAGINGARACARGLRHALGVHAAVSEVPETRIQSWLGHASLETTAVYLGAVGFEDRAIAKRMWRDEPHN